MIIKEFLPNPVASDQEGEYIKLLNDGPAAVLLNGWKIKDAAGKTYQLSGSLPGGRELILPYSQTKISLNNNGEKIFLYDSAGKLIDQLSYSGQAEEGRVIVRSKKLEVGSLTDEEINFGIQHPTLNIQQVVFLDILTAVILAALGLYIIKQLEKKLDIKLF